MNDGKILMAFIIIAAGAIWVQEPGSATYPDKAGSGKVWDSTKRGSLLYSIPPEFFGGISQPCQCQSCRTMTSSINIHN